jgi:uncharacterized protein YoxC
MCLCDNINLTYSTITAKLKQVNAKYNKCLEKLNRLEEKNKEDKEKLNFINKVVDGVKQSDEKPFS